MASTERRPNVLLITTDQQRFDTIGAYGSRQVKTPNLDRLAESSVLFERAYVQNPVCIPSRACIQTGRYAHQHGLEYMADVIDDGPALSPSEITFMERLQCCGYRTAAFGKIHMLPITPARGFHEQKLTGGKGGRWTKSAGLPIGLGPLGRDYAAWLEERHPGAYESIYAQRREPEYRHHKSAMTHVLPVDEYIDSWITDNTIEFIRREHHTPFFVQCGLTGPHGPVAAPEPYASMYSPREVPLPENYSIDIDGNPRATKVEQDALARRWWAFYAGLVSLIDDCVGRVVGALEEKGLLENTLILFTSDHGDMAFERGRGGKALFFEAVIRMPLIVVPPRPSSLGSDAGGLVETYDIAPTILDYACAQVPDTMSAASLRPIVEGRGVGKEMALSEYRSNDRTERGICVRTEGFKYAYWGHGDVERFFDLDQDPLERHNRVGDPACQEEVARHRRLLIDRLVHTPA